MPIESIGMPFGSVVMKLIAQTSCAAVVGETFGLRVAVVVGTAVAASVTAVADVGLGVVVATGVGEPPGFTP
jgi:hypothetical protein